MDIECRAAFFVLACSLINMFLSVLSVFAVGAYLLFNKKRFTAIRSDNNNLFAFAFVALTLIVALFYGNFLGVLVSLFVFFAFVIMMSFCSKITRKIFEDFITLYLSYSVFAFIVAVVEKFIFGAKDSVYRSSSTFLNPLYYSYFIAFAVIFCAYRLAVLPRWKAMNVAVLLINVFAMLLSGGRMPWMGMFAGTLITLMLCRKYKLVAIFSGGIFLMVLTAILFPDLEILRALRLDSITSGYTSRIPYWNMALEGFGKQPLFGKGFLGMLNDTMKSSSESISKVPFSLDFAKMLTNVKNSGAKLHAHNIIFDCLYNFGIFGTMILALCLLRYCTHMYRDLGYNSSNPHIALLAGILVAIGVNGILDNQIIGPQTSVFTILIFSMCAIKEEKSRNVNTVEARQKPPSGKVYIPHK
ncbi:MAG: O-antigen ligase family protein [Clostridia bacterium]|nr:O-antigen ligase family protein [Clostridia bacterium]